MTNTDFRLLIEPLKCAPPFVAYAIDIPKTSLDERNAILAECLQTLFHGAEATGLGEPTTWIDTQELHRDGGSKLLGQHARRWSPRMGFAFDPAGPPPRKLQMSDLMDMEYGGTLRLDDRTAIHVSSLAESIDAYRSLAGRGLSVLLFFGQPSSSGTMQAAVNGYMQGTQQTLRSLMAPGQFQSFPFYLPLITAAAVTQATAEQLALWLGTAELYIRESADEVLLLSRRGLEQLLAAAGLRRLQPEEGSSWALPDRNHSGENRL